MGPRARLPARERTAPSVPGARVVRGAAGMLVLVAVLLAAVLGGASERPPLGGDGISLTPVRVVAGLLSLVFLALLVVLVGSLRRQVLGPGDEDRSRRGAGIVLVLFLLLLLGPQLADPSRIGLGTDGVPAPLTDAEGTIEDGRVTPSTTAAWAGALALVLAATGLLLRLRSSAGPPASTPEETSAIGASARRVRPAATVDPEGDPRAVVLAAYDVARRLVEPVVGAASTDGPLAVLRRTRGTRLDGPFGELTRAYLPLRFGTAAADDAIRDAAVAAFGQLRRELDA